MTESSLDSEVIKKTQETLGKFIKKPPLTEKLLKKPPFKFILDIVKAVSRFKKLASIFYRSNRLCTLHRKKGSVNIDFTQFSNNFVIAGDS